MYIKSSISYLILSFSVLITSAYGIEAPTLEVLQSLTDGVNDVDGLDNPRAVVLSHDSHKAYVASGDDNSLAVFDVNSEGYLTLRQVIKSNRDEGLYLEGAASLVELSQARRLAVVSFYDGALSVFANDNAKVLQQVQVISNFMPVEQVFKSNNDFKNADTYGLLGAWQIVKSVDEKDIFVASYKSDVVARFKLQDNKLVFASKLPVHKQPLGNPIDVVISQDNNYLFVLGFEGNRLTIYRRNTLGEFDFLQQIDNSNAATPMFENPQKMTLSGDAKTLYVANSANASISVFSQQAGRYKHVQTVAKAALKGASSLLLSHDNTVLFAAGEQGEGIILFNIAKDGQLSFKQTLNTANKQIKSVSSLALGIQPDTLLITLAISDSILLIKAP